MRRRPLGILIIPKRYLVRRGQVGTCGKLLIKRSNSPVASEPMSPDPKTPKRRPVQREIAKKAVDGLSRFLQSRSKLVESPFPPRNQTWKQTFWTGSRKPNSYPNPLMISCCRSPEPNLTRLPPRVSARPTSDKTTSWFIRLLGISEFRCAPASSSAPSYGKGCLAERTVEGRSSLRRGSFRKNRLEPSG